MASATAVTHSTSQTSHSQASNSAESAAESGAAGNSFEQALFDLLQAGLVDQAGLEQALEGLELPSSGEELPSFQQLSQLLEGEVGPEQLQELKDLYGLLQKSSETMPVDGELPDQLIIDEAALKELLASIKDLREGVRKGEITSGEAYQQFAETLESFGFEVPEEVSREIELKTKSEEPDLVQLLVQTLKSERQAHREELQQVSPEVAGSGSIAGVQVDELVPVRLKPDVVKSAEADLSDNASKDKVSSEQVVAAKPVNPGDVEDAESDAAKEVEKDVEREARAAEQVASSSAQTVAANSVSQAQASQPAVANTAVTESQRTLTGAEVRAEVRSAGVTETSPQASSGNSQNNANDNSGQQDRDLNRAQQFREAMLSQRLDSAGKEAAESNRSSVLSQSFVLPGQASTEPATRLNPAMSGFQQLQQAYTTSMSGQVTLNAGAQFGAQNWAGNISQRVSWMMNQKVGHAEIRLDPPDLGSLNIRLTVQNDQATVQFVSPNAQVRDALEQQMPRLREMLEESGIQLEQGDVSEHADSSGQESEGEALTDRGMVETNEEELLAPNMAAQGSNLSLVDYYA